VTEMLLNVGAFSLKSLVLGLVVFGGLLMVISAAMKAKAHEKELEVEDLSEKSKKQTLTIQARILPPKDFKKLLKKEKKSLKDEKKHHDKPKLFVLSFKGDMKASQVDQLRTQVSSVIEVSNPQKDQVLVCIESPGGMVHGYGLAAAQLKRMREKGLHVVAAVDQVAASGGYLMAAVAHEIIAAPFAVVGSIGVVAQVPNIHRLLKKHDVDYEEVTSGKFKRSISYLGKITDEGREHFEKKIGDTHELFKSFVKESRPQLDLEEVGNGDHWYGSEALKLGLIDRIQTSDDFIMESLHSKHVIQIKTPESKNLVKKFASAAIEKAMAPFYL